MDKILNNTNPKTLEDYENYIFDNPNSSYYGLSFKQVKEKGIMNFVTIANKIDSSRKKGKILTPLQQRFYEYALMCNLIYEDL